MHAKERGVDESSIARQRPVYVPYDREIAIDFGIPEHLYGPEELMNFVVDTRIYIVSPESPIGKLTTAAGDESFMLTAPIYKRAIRLREIIDEFPTGRVIYMMLSKVPMGMFGWSQTPIEVIESSPDTEFQFVDGPLAEALNDPSSKALIVDIEKIWRDAGAKKDHKVPKPLRITRYNLP